MSDRHGNLQKYENPNPVQRFLIARFQRSLLELVEAVAPESILDLGCGEGFNLAYLRDHGVRARMTGVDLSAEAIADARRRLGEEVELHCADATQSGALGRYDLVIATEVLEHLAKPEPLVEAMVERSRAAVIASVPREPFFRGLNFLRGKHVRQFGNDPEHLQNWGAASFRQFLSRFVDVEAAPTAFPWTLLLGRLRAKP